MAIAFVQQAKNGATNATFSGGSVTFGVSATAGNCIVVILRDYNSASAPQFVTVSSVSDTAGNTYSLATSYTATDPAFRIYVAKNITGGFTTVTVNVSVSVNTDYWWIWAGEYSGVDTTTAVDTSATGTNNGTATTSLVSTAITTSTSGEAIVLAGSQNNLFDFSAGTNFTLRDGQIGQGASHYGGVEDYITTGTLSSYTAGITSTGSAQYTTAWVALKPSAGGGSTQPLFRPSPLNGIGSGGPFFNNPIGRSMLGWRPKLVTA